MHIYEIQELDSKRRILGASETRLKLDPKAHSNITTLENPESNSPEKKPACYLEIGDYSGGGNLILVGRAWAIYGFCLLKRSQLS